MMLALDLTDTFLIAGFICLCVALLAIPEILYERFDRRRHPEREARRLKFKPVWKILSVLAWNGGVIGALIVRGDLAAAVAAVLLLASYGVFRYFLYATRLCSDGF
jgi:hypothetical protein